MTRSTWFVVAALCVAACGSSSGSPGPAPAGTTSVSGMAASMTVSMKDATGVVGPVTASGVTAQETDVILTNFVGACSSVQSNGNPANGQLIAIVVAAISPVGPGTYNVTANGAAQVLFESQDANCVTQVAETAQSGTVTYETVNGSMVAGKVDVTFPSMDHFSGTFEAPVCDFSPSNLAMLSGQSPMACKAP